MIPDSSVLMFHLVTHCGLDPQKWEICHFSEFGICCRLGPVGIMLESYGIPVGILWNSCGIMWESLAELLWECCGIHVGIL